MKLYYSAGSCSTSCHIILEESGLKYEAVEVDWDSADESQIGLVNRLNPLGTLPILITDNGKQLDQNLAIQIYVADLVPDKKLLPVSGTIERAEALNFLSFVAADFHKALGALFSVSQFSEDRNIQESIRQAYLTEAHKVLNYLNDKLVGKRYLLGDSFGPADAYAFVVAGWTRRLEIPLNPYLHIETFLKRVAERPAVAHVLQAEGL